ncbi:histidinol-phosphate transaminase [Denitratisoma sp. agr-D3]
MTIRPRPTLLDPTLQRPSALASKPRAPSLIWLDKNENLDPTLMQVTSAVLQKVDRSALTCYPEAGALYRKLGAWAGVSPDSLLLTPGSDGAIRLVFESFVEPGDLVFITEPTFAMYPVYAKMFGARVTALQYQPGERGPQLDYFALARLVREQKPKLLCLPNPDSPTGTVAPPDAMAKLLAACEVAGTVFLVDEAYHPFHSETQIGHTQTSHNLVVARTFAKAWGVAGLRIGYAAAHPETIGLLHKMRPMYEVSTLATDFMTHMLDNSDAMQASVDRTLAGKQWFASEMRALGFEVLETAGNFLHVRFGAAGTVVHRAMEDRVLYRKGFDVPALAGYSRFSMAPQEILAPVVGLIQEALKGIT